MKSKLRKCIKDLIMNASQILIKHELNIFLISYKLNIYIILYKI